MAFVYLHGCVSWIVLVRGKKMHVKEESYFAEGYEETSKQNIFNDMPHSVRKRSIFTLMYEFLHKS